MNIAIPLIRMTVGELLARISLLLIVILWSIPTFGLLVSSFRTRDAIATAADGGHPYERTCKQQYSARVQKGTSW
jgi:ABC-type glycerol-3-phosphate transport system permease component